MNSVLITRKRDHFSSFQSIPFKAEKTEVNFAQFNQKSMSKCHAPHINIVFSPRFQISIPASYMGYHNRIAFLIYYLCLKSCSTITQLNDLCCRLWNTGLYLQKFSNLFFFSFGLLFELIGFCGFFFGE